MESDLDNSIKILEVENNILCTLNSMKSSSRFGSINTEIDALVILILNDIEIKLHFT